MIDDNTGSIAMPLTTINAQVFDRSDPSLPSMGTFFFFFCATGEDR